MRTLSFKIRAFDLKKNLSYLFQIETTIFGKNIEIKNR